MNLNRCSLFTKPLVNLLYKHALAATVGTRIQLLHCTPSVSSMYEKRARDKEKRLKGKNKYSMKSVLITQNEMTVKELAVAMEKTPLHVFACLEQIGVPIRNRRDTFMLKDIDIITKILKLSNMRLSFGKQAETDYDQLINEIDLKNETIAKRSANLKALTKRPPCVTIMGHVDHGKTTLLDALRGSHIVDGEFGGITQHIGAFNCKLPTMLENKKVERNITFLDTPGHAAYSMMRSRGAKCTDIIVLVIAAEDSIMAQTIESINHAKASDCKVIVAINKIDKASPKQLLKCKNDLLQYGLIPEEMGGETQVVEISALKNINLDLLKEEIWACAEVMDLHGDPKGLVEGYVIESKQDLYKGKMATVLVKRGNLRKGSFLVAGNTWCKVKDILDENSLKLSEATLSQAVQIMGWKDLPHSGDEVLQLKTENQAKDLVELRNKRKALVKIKSDKEIINKKREEHEKLFKEKRIERRSKGLKFIQAPMYDDEGKLLTTETIDTVHNHFKPKTVHIIIKTDVDGSLDAILNVLETYDSSDKVILDLVHFEVGPVKKNDLELAETFNASIYCFNLPTDPIEKTIQNKNIQVKHYNVIYKLFDELKAELANLAPMEEVEEPCGEALIQKEFSYDESNTKIIKVAGSRCVEGLINKKHYFNIIRDGEVIAERLRCHSLKHIKTEVNTVKKNVEFGIAFVDYDESLMSGDKIVCYSVNLEKTTLEWNLGF